MMTNEALGIFDSVDKTFEFIRSNPANQRGRSSIQWVAHYMDTFLRYAAGCRHITEFGVNQVNSTWAWLKVRPAKIVLVDPCLFKSKYGEENIWLKSFLELAAKEGVAVDTLERSSTEIEMEPTDLLYIDSLHKYSHTLAELRMHASRVRKYIILHDTVLFKQEVTKALYDFLREDYQWQIKESFNDEVGLTILHRI